ncbi:hypothetical protein TGARI_272000 [Toxoplasma gondii ARI]|uniref:Uncharacterized protein n=1 Tax=Toxoplasma gondii ARI TaxID=1074872 RepID=A0A139Y6W8_TOXGO|nr:hypothetical protein TGARI_272000 [Toxoplasma gondii ARI]
MKRYGQLSDVLDMLAESMSIYEALRASESIAFASRESRAGSCKSAPALQRNSKKTEEDSSRPRVSDAVSHETRGSRRRQTDGQEKAERAPRKEKHSRNGEGRHKQKKGESRVERTDKNQRRSGEPPRSEERRTREVSRKRENGEEETWVASWFEEDGGNDTLFFPLEKDMADWGREAQKLHSDRGEKPRRRESEGDTDWPSVTPSKDRGDRAAAITADWAPASWGEAAESTSDAPEETPRERDTRRSRDAERPSEKPARKGEKNGERRRERSGERKLARNDEEDSWGSRANHGEERLSSRESFPTARDEGCARRGDSYKDERRFRVSFSSVSSRSDLEESFQESPLDEDSWDVHVMVHRALFLPVSSSGSYVVVASLLTNSGDRRQTLQHSGGRASAGCLARAVSAPRSSNSSGECVWEETLVLSLGSSFFSGKRETLMHALREASLRFEISEPVSLAPLATALEPVALPPLVRGARRHGSVSLRSSRGGNGGSLSFSLCLEKGRAQVEDGGRREKLRRKDKRERDAEASLFFDAGLAAEGLASERSDFRDPDRERERRLQSSRDVAQWPPTLGTSVWNEGTPGPNGGFADPSAQDPSAYFSGAASHPVLSVGSPVPNGGSPVPCVGSLTPGGGSSSGLEAQNAQLSQQSQQLQNLLLASQQREQSLHAQLQASQGYMQQVLQVLSATQVALKQREGEGEKARASALALEETQREVRELREQLRARTEEERGEASEKATLKRTVETQKVELEKMKTKLSEQSDLLRDARERLAVQRRRCARLRDDLVEADELTEAVKTQLSLSQSQEQEQQRQILALAYCLGIQREGEGLLEAVEGSRGALAPLRSSAPGLFGRRDDEAVPQKDGTGSRALALRDGPRLSPSFQLSARLRERQRGDTCRVDACGFLIRECGAFTAEDQAGFPGVSPRPVAARRGLRGLVRTREGRLGAQRARRACARSPSAEATSESAGETRGRRGSTEESEEETDGDREDQLESTVVEDWRLTPTVLLALRQRQVSPREVQSVSSALWSRLPHSLSQAPFLSLPLQPSPCSLLQQQVLTALFQQALLGQKREPSAYLLYETDALQVFWSAHFLAPSRCSLPLSSSSLSSALCAASVSLAQLASRAFATHSRAGDSPDAALVAAARAWEKDTVYEQRTGERRYGESGPCQAASGCLFALSLRASAGQALEVAELRLERQVFGSQGAFTSLDGGGIEQATLLPRQSPVTLFGSTLVAGPFRQPPIVRLSYLLPDSVKREIRLRLPLPPAAFCWPRRMRPHAFVRDWNSLSSSSTSLICDKLKPSFFSPAAHLDLARSPHTSLLRACTLSDSFASLPGLDRRFSRNVVAAGFFPVSAPSRRLFRACSFAKHPSEEQLHAPWDSAPDVSDTVSDLSDQASDDTAVSFSSPSFRPRKGADAGASRVTVRAARRSRSREGDMPSLRPVLPCLLRVELLSVSAAVAAGVLPALPTASGPTSQIWTSSRGRTASSLARLTAQPVSSAAAACARIEVRCPDEEVRQSVVETLAEVLMDDELLASLSSLVPALEAPVTL